MLAIVQFILIYFHNRLHLLIITKSTHTHTQCPRIVIGHPAVLYAFWMHMRPPQPKEDYNVRTYTIQSSSMLWSIVTLPKTRVKLVRLQFRTDTCLGVCAVGAAAAVVARFIAGSVVWKVCQPNLTTTRRTRIVYDIWRVCVLGCYSEDPFVYLIISGQENTRGRESHRA